MHLLADARERMIPEDVSKEDDEAVDWGDLLAAGDPCTNPNFDIQREDFTLKILPLE